MGRIAYVNGQYVPHADAAVHIEDRGYQFSDGVYEVIAIFKSKLIDEDGHLDRLERSLRELEIEAPMSRRALSRVMRETIRRNRVDEGDHLYSDHPGRCAARPCIPGSQRHAVDGDDRVAEGSQGTA